MRKSGIFVAILACFGLAVAARAQTAATGQITLNSVTGTIANPVYNYTLALTDTGSTNIGTFWFAWVPGQDYLPSVPSTVGNPTGFSDVLTGSGNSSDGTAIQWEAHANAGNFLTPGSTQDFGFSTADSPSVLEGFSPSHPTVLTTTSFVYAGGTAFTGTSDEFVVSVPEPASGALLLACGAGLMKRRCRV